MTEATSATRLAATARYIAFGLTVLLAVVGGAFLIGETLMDPGGASTVALAVAWSVVTVVLAVSAVWRPEPATRILTVLALLVAALIVVDLVFRVVPRDEIGPVGSASALAVVVGLGFLGVRRPAEAGRLLLVTGVAAVGAGGSGVALAGPVLAIAGLFLLAAGWGSHRRTGSGPRNLPGPRGPVGRRKPDAPTSPPSRARKAALVRRFETDQRQMLAHPPGIMVHPPAGRPARRPAPPPPRPAPSAPRRSRTPGRTRPASPTAPAAGRAPGPAPPCCPC